MLFTLPWKLSYQTAAEESDRQASGSVKQLNVKGICVFSSDEEDIKDNKIFSKGASTEKKVQRK
uniref:Uncharacterized protein n=1 Tax=Romanomermis culicivorax TaxID=13658 RepID=A0A915IW39_ROMCU